MKLLKYGLVLKETGEPLGLTAIKNEVSGRHTHELSHDPLFYSNLIWMISQRENAEYVRQFNKNRKTTSVDLPKHFYDRDELEVAAFVVTIARSKVDVNSGANLQANPRRKYMFVHGQTKRPVYVRLFEDRTYAMNFQLYHEFRQSDFLWVTSNPSHADKVLRQNKSLSPIYQHDMNPGHDYDSSDLLLCEMEYQIITDRDEMYELQEEQNLARLRRSHRAKARAAEGIIDSGNSDGSQSSHWSLRTNAGHSRAEGLRA